MRKDGKYNINKQELQRWLQESEVYSTHVKKNRAKHFYGVTVPEPGYMYDSDVGYMNVDNGKIKNFIVLIDLFSRKASAKILRDVKASSVKDALLDMIQELGPVKKLRSDRGKEYISKLTSSALKQKGIQQVFAFPPFKANYGERLIRSLKSRLFKVMQYHGDNQWWKYLPDVIKAYNEGYHSSLGMSPNQVTEENVPQLWYRFKRQRLKNIAPFKDKYKFEVNDGVRVALIRRPMEKDHFELNSTTVYFISYRYSRAHIHRYKLKDSNNEPLQGSFTENQLEKTQVDKQTVYRVEKILHYKYLGRGKNRARYAKVKWFQMSSKYNSYVLVKDIAPLRR